MKEWGIAILPDADAELDGIYSYIADSLLEPETAKKLFARIIKAILSLKQMPERFRLYENEPWRSKGLRVLPVGNFIILYHIEQASETVFIDSILYGARDIDKALDEKLDE